MTTSQLSLEQHPSADTCLGRMTCAFETMTVALCAGLSLYFNYNCTFINKSYFLKLYVNMRKHFMYFRGMPIEPMFSIDSLLSWTGLGILLEIPLET